MAGAITRMPLSFGTALIELIDVAQSAQSHKRQALRIEASLLGRQVSDEPPELGESQLPVVVLVLGAHELLDRAGGAGVL